MMPIRMGNESKNERVEVMVRLRLTTHQLTQWINGGDSTIYNLVYDLFPLHEYDAEGCKIVPKRTDGGSHYVEYDDENDCAYLEYQFPARKASE